MIYIVYGSPCSGKSTYIKQHAGRNDLIVDTDAIYSAISGHDEHDTDSELYQTAMSVLREDLYDLIKARRGKWENVWVASVCRPSELLQLMDRIDADEAIYMNTPKEECLRRANERGEPWRERVQTWFRG